MKRSEQSCLTIYLNRNKSQLLYRFRFRKKGHTLYTNQRQISMQQTTAKIQSLLFQYFADVFALMQRIVGIRKSSCFYVEQ